MDQEVGGETAGRVGAVGGMASVGRVYSVRRLLVPAAAPAGDVRTHPHAAERSLSGGGEGIAEHQTPHPSCAGVRRFRAEYLGELPAFGGLTGFGGPRPARMRSA